MYTVIFVNYSTIKLEKKKDWPCVLHITIWDASVTAGHFMDSLASVDPLFWTSDLGISISKTVNFLKEMILSVYSYCLAYT